MSPRALRGAAKPIGADVFAALHAADQHLSKKLENHAAAVSLYIAHYNLCRVHEALTQSAKHQKR